MLTTRLTIPGLPLQHLTTPPPALTPGPPGADTCRSHLSPRLPPTCNQAPFTLEDSYPGPPKYTWAEGVWRKCHNGTTMSDTSVLRPTFKLFCFLLTTQMGLYVPTGYFLPQDFSFFLIINFLLQREKISINKNEKKSPDLPTAHHSGHPLDWKLFFVGVA